MDRELTLPVAADRWRAMGSDIEVVVVGADAAALVATARDRIEALESRWSRFRADSDVSRLNAQPGVPVEVHPDTVRLVRVAIDAWRESGGAVNPTVLGAVLAAGYDDRFEVVAERATSGSTPSLTAIIACTDIEIDGTTVTLPAGTGFDPGGIGKGLAADVVADELRASGAAGVCVNLGGDVRVSGTGPRGDGWTVAVERPEPGGAPLVLVGVADGAVATSTTVRRQWNGPDGERRHHLIDPWTGRSSATDVVQATVIAATCVAAERHAKTIVLRGSARAFDLLPVDVPAVRVDADGVVSAAGPLADFLGGHPLIERIDALGVAGNVEVPS